MAEKHERPILAIILRKNQEVDRRHYSRLNTAIRRMTELAMLEAEPRDVVEFSHKGTGMQIGTMKVGVKGIKTDWTWDRKEMLSNCARG